MQAISRVGTCVAGEGMKLVDPCKFRTSYLLGTPGLVDPDFSRRRMQDDSGDGRTRAPEAMARRPRLRGVQGGRRVARRSLLGERLKYPPSEGPGFMDSDSELGDPAPLHQPRESAARAARRAAARELFEGTEPAFQRQRRLAAGSSYKTHKKTLLKEGKLFDDDPNDVCIPVDIPITSDGYKHMCVAPRKIPVERADSHNSSDARCS